MGVLLAQLLNKIMYDKNKLLTFRKQKDQAWKTSTESPLTEEQKKISCPLQLRLEKKLYF